MESRVDSMFNGFTYYQETIERRNTGYHVNIHDLYKHLIDDRMKALDSNEQVLLKRRITIIHVDDVKALDIAHDANILNTLKSIDYEKLSRHNTSVPGFGKADVINEYIKITNREPQDAGLFA